MSIYLLGKIVNHYKGFAGAVKCVQCSPEGSGEDLVAAYGLDRYLRVYTINPPKLKHQVWRVSVFSDYRCTVACFQD